MILSFIIPFAVAVLSGLGVGGGGLFMIYLTLFTETPQLLAQGSNLLFFLFSSSAALCIHVSRRRLYPMLILLLVLSGLGGALLGTLIAEHLNGLLLRRIFGIMLVITGIFTLKKK